MQETLLHTLFPDVRAEVIRHLFSNPIREVHVRQLARITTLALRTVQRELARLSAANLIGSRSNGYYLFYRANRKHAAFSALQQLVNKDRSPTVYVSQHKRPRLGRRLRRRPDPLRRSNFITSLSIKRSL